MDPEQFRRDGKLLVDYIADYAASIRDYKVLPDVEPGFLRDLLPTQAPQKPESYEAVMEDFKSRIMPGVTQWHHPHFLAYYPTGYSLPSVLGGMLCDAIANIGFSWISSPSCTELEVITLDWLVHALKLPAHFLSTSERGGGVIQGSASEATLMAVLAARSRCLREQKLDNPNLDIGMTLNKMVAYASDQAHCSVQRACDISLVKLKALPSNADRSLEGETLRLAIEEDRANGLIPLICIATIGTTNSCAVDDVEGLAAACNKANIWCHVDAAYAGTALICPEYQHLGKGLELVDSFNYNAHKMMRVVFDCSPMWLKDKEPLIEAFNVDPQYLKHDETRMPDFRHWQLPLGRRFRSLKLFFVMRMFGIEGLQAFFRKHVQLTKKFESLLQQDPRFEIVAPVNLGLVCFRVTNDNEKTKQLLDGINKDQRIFLVSSTFERENIFYIRVTPSAVQSEETDMQFAYDVICEIFNRL